jgi:hypothetical protein
MSMMHYEIRVEGQLDPRRWSRWFEGMRIRPTDEGNTTISGLVLDQSSLHGMLAKVRDLGLILISVQRAESGDSAHLDAKKE